MTSEPGEQPASGPNENQNPGGLPGQPQYGPGGGYWHPQAPPGPPPYWPGYGEPGGSWAYGPPYATPPGTSGWTWQGGPYPGAVRRRPHVGLLIAGGMAALLVAGTIGGFIGDAIGSSGTAVARSFTPAVSPARPGSGFGGFPSGGFGQPASGGSSSSGSSSTGSGPANAAAIASRVDPGLVDVNTTVDYGQAKAAGTGMVLSPDGVVLTNNHVIDGATSISVTDVGNGKTYRASVAGYDRGKDVAILKLSGASNLKTVTIARSGTVSAGTKVVGIGNAGGTGGTPSYAGGTVTGTGKSITASDDLSGTSEQLTGMIETNANIQAGDSGGPLVNSSGQVVGMDTAGSQTFQFASQQATNAFAIPISVATNVGNQILDSQSATGVHLGPTAFLGIEIGQSSSGAPGSGFGSGSGNAPAPGSGVQIAGVVNGSPAAKAGLAAGDVITSVDGHPAASQNALQRVMVNDVTPGQSVTVGYTTASGQQHSASVTLASGPPQ
jgi:S1-C subfamily serine protease